MMDNKIISNYPYHKKLNNNGYLDQSGRGALKEDEVQDPGDEAEREVGGEDGEEPGRGVQGGVSLQPDQ